MECANYVECANYAECDGKRRDSKKACPHQDLFAAMHESAVGLWLWNVGASGLCLVRFDVGRADHFGPFLGFFGDQASELGGRAAKYGQTQVGQSHLHLWVC